MATAARTKTPIKTNGSASANDVEASLEQVKRDIASLTETLSSYGKGKVGSAQKSASAKSDEVLKLSEEKLNELSAQVQNLTRQAENRVREKPLQSLAIAAGVGVLVAMLARR